MSEILRGMLPGEPARNGLPDSRPYRYRRYDNLRDDQEQLLRLLASAETRLPGMGLTVPELARGMQPPRTAAAVRQVTAVLLGKQLIASTGAWEGGVRLVITVKGRQALERA